MSRQLARGGATCPKCQKEMDRRAEMCIACRSINPAGQARRRARSAELLRDYRNGIGMADLAAEHGVTIQRIQQLLMAGRADEGMGI